MKIEELDFSVRTYNCLKRAKVDTVEQLSGMSDGDLMMIRCFEQKCLDEVKAKIALPRKTNADWIRAMSDRELAEWMAECNAYGEHADAGQWLPWLQQPVEEVPDNE